MKTIDNKLKYSLLVRLIFLLGIFYLVGCSKDNDPVEPENPNPEEYNRTALLTNYANEYIIPAYKAYYNQLTDFKNEVTLFNSTPTVGSLQNLRTKWENTLLIWQDVAFLEFGPAANISLRAQTNIYPIDTGLINSNITTGTYNLEAGANFDAKGFQALDYLLNGVRNTDIEFINYYSNNPNAMTYIQDIVNDLHTNSLVVKDDWQDNYSSNFIANSASNAQGSSISDVVNALSQHYETYIRKGKIGLPVGVFNGFSKQPMSEHVESYYSEKSLPYVYRSLTSLQNFIKGKGYTSLTNGEGLDDYINFVNAQSNGEALEVIIDNQFNIIQAELANINDPLSNEVINNQSGVEKVYQKMQMLVPYIKVEMTSALEVLITYQDADGD